MLAGYEKDLAKSLTSEMLRFGDDFIDVERNAKDRIVARETAIPAIVDALVGKIKRSEEAHRPPKILQRDRARKLCHRFKLLIRFGGDHMFEALNQLRFLENKLLQGLDEPN